MPVNRRQDPCAPLVLKIDFGHHVADTAAQLNYLNVIGMNTISVEDRAIAKDRNQTGVIRPWRMERVDTDRKAFDPRDDGVQRSQLRHVIITSSLRSVGAIFPDNDVGQHFSYLSLN